MTPRLSTITAEEKSAAFQYLDQTRDALSAAVQNLSGAQWRFRPSPDRWSPAEVVEHLAMIEERVYHVVSTIGGGEEADPGRNTAEMDRRIMAEIPARTGRVEAPPPVRPLGECEPEQALARFLEARARLRELLDGETVLRGRVRQHPIFGAWDGYQWLIGAGAHSARHTAQILEIKAHEGFPA